MNWNMRDLCTGTPPGDAWNGNYFMLNWSVRFICKYQAARLFRFCSPSYLAFLSLGYNGLLCCGSPLGSDDPAVRQESKSHSQGMFRVDSLSVYVVSLLFQLVYHLISSC